MNDLMLDFRAQLAKGQIQKAYRYIFDIFADLGRELKAGGPPAVNTNALYHGYLDMTYLPVVTETLKNHGLKIAVVFNYSSFQFELWLSAVNRRRRLEVREKLKGSTWNRCEMAASDRNPDAIIEFKVRGISEFGDRNRIVASLAKETFAFIGEIEKFVLNRRP